MRAFTGRDRLLPHRPQAWAFSIFISCATRALGDPGGIRVPIEFFDTSYKIDRLEARRARSALGEVIARAMRRRAFPSYFRFASGTLRALTSRSAAISWITCGRRVAGA